MKKVLSVMAVSAFVLTAGVALAGGPGKKMDAGCPEACQQQIDDLNSSQAQQNEQLGAHGKQLENHEGRITALEKADVDPWYGRVGVRAAWMEQDIFGNNAAQVDSVDSDVGFGGAVAFGREFSEFNTGGKFRAEVELAYQGADLDEGSGTFNGQSLGVIGQTIVNTRIQNAEYKLLTVMANGYYSIPVADAFSVYAMAGMGFAQYELEADIYTRNAAGFLVQTGSPSSSDNVFAYKAGVGMSYDFTDQIAGDLGFEYLGVADTDLADSINGYNAVASVRFKF
jgi:opacity protein-like surface antigen